MTFSEFQDTRKSMTVAELEAFTTGDHDNLQSAFCYDDSAWLGVMPNGKYWMTTGRDEWLGDDLVEMEARLYFFWYVSECNDGEYDEVDLGNMLFEFAREFKLTWKSADAMLNERMLIEHRNRTLDNNDQISFLFWYIDRWEESELRGFELKSRG